MANSPLDLVNSDAFRKKLITRNLTPYAKAPNRPSLPTNIEYIQSDVSVQDSPDQLIDEPSLANQLYPLNRWGAEGGFKQVPDPGALTNNKSNQGEYGPGQQDAHIIDQAQIEQYNWKPINAYSNGTQEVLDSGEYITEPDFIRSGTPNLYNNQPYPTTFVPSSYAPVSILLNPDPLGNNGLLSQDSFLAQLGAKTLKKEFQDRIALNIYQNTLGRANLFNVDSGTDILNLVTTRVPLIEPNWTITVPENPVLAAADFALRLAGSIIPISPIPGSYFDTSITLGQPTTIQQIQNAFRQSNTGVGKFFSRLLGADRTGTQIFLNNTGGGQKSRLFGNLKFNRYKPGYDRNVFDRLAGVLVGARENNSNYYIGSVTSEPSRVFSPAGDLPVSPFGAEMQSPVYGPTELAQLYEGPNREIRLGANAPAYIDGGGLEGGLTWVSPKYRNNAGKKVGLGGEVTNPDENFRPSSYVTTESTNIEFRTGSIMDDTQRLIDSQPNGGRRLQHVGNAIDQVSKVFHDGYKEMTKGSRVLSYVGSLGQEVGTEYCRVFAKDLPYSQYSDLQKTNGVVNEGRRFSYSVFDKTYNLNMYPNKQEGGQDSSNLIGTGAQSYAKKYMFSLENLAWRTSHTPGINVNDLPICERGPNGGRVMWFPPYALTFSENARANWKENDFLGRPEKIYTYTNSSRDGSISWKIVVDHPSILNVIVNKVLSNANNSERINGLLDSFFAGCKKYDLYELAKKYYTISPNELAVLQQIVSSKQASKEVVGAIRNSQASGALNTGGQSQNTTQPVQQTASETFKQFENLALFFPNAQPVPPPSTVAPYSSYYTTYEAQVGGVYKGESENFFNNIVKSNYDEINVKFIDQLSQYLKDNPASVVSIFLQATASKPADDAYNLRLSERRNESVIKFFSENPKLKQYVDNRRLTFPAPEALGESGEVFQYDGTRFISNVKTEKCSNYQPNDITNNDSTNPNITNQIAMACRRVTIKKIQVSSPQTVQQPSQANLPSTQGGIQSTPQNRPIGQAEIEPKFRKADWITKRIVRNLISECDYFETIKEETPMVYDNLKQKLKFFQPGFHSTTPEGLNSRLTFLQQCLRPGDTIPTVNPQPNGSYQLDFNNAVNTAFGLPPVLVLRIGDFYHTKIIPTTLQLQFEGLDINPEGIGIQPMIANVTLGFNFVGGQGLKNAIDKLQNGLSFNFYANTEMWDERADATDMDNLKVISKDFLQMVQNPSAPTTNQTQNTNGLSNATTIGNKVSSSIATTGETGVMSYTEFMDTIITQSQTYFQTMFNQSKSTFNQYNNAILQQWSLDNIYQQGDLLCNPSLVNGALLFGKNDNFQKNIDTIFSDLLDDIKNKDDRFIEYINSQGVNFSDKAIRIITENYTNYINNKKSTYSNALTKLIQDTTTNQQSFIQYLSRLNTVLYIPPAATINGTDGYQQKNGVIIVYNLKQKTNEYTELVNDGAKIGQALFDYYNVLKSKTDFRVGDKSYSGFLAYWDNSSNPQSLTNEVFNPFSKALLFGEKPFRRQYAILSNDLKSENYNNFKAAIVGQLIVNPSLGGKTGKDNFSEVFDNYWNKKAKPLFDEENSLTNTFLDTIEKDKLGNFLNFTPYPLGKVREFTFERDDTPDSGQKKLIKSLGALNNSNRDKKSWNSLDGANIYISKVKLN